MERFVKALYDRLESKPELQMQLFVIMQKAIDEMHNNGIIATLTGEAAQRVHDSDPEVRITEKTILAKSVGKQFIPLTGPIPSKTGFSFSSKVEYNPRFVNSITLCLQGGIEGLQIASSGNAKINWDKYIIKVTNKVDDLSAFKDNIEKLDKMYDGVSIVLQYNDKIIYPTQCTCEDNSAKDSSSAKTKSEKKSLFAKIFGKK